MSADEFIEEFEIRLRRIGADASEITLELSAGSICGDRSAVTVDKICITPEKRQRGIATHALHLLTLLADERGIDLYTIPHSLDVGGMDDGALKVWYESFGFECATTGSIPSLMRRVHRG
jgi:hypothetical protein